ncbi:hypothetical protein ACFVIM_11600 [Streptomyces sp. NPDC057638]|uniref:hypothetical protein n=1 Tax=Streptomyces sp. NPDC057638 TaxID=3346190 RepID=UPI003693DD86
MDVSDRRLRALRAAIFTALVVTLSAASHVLLSRAPLPWFTVAALATGVFAVAYALGGRQRGYWRIASLLVPLQLIADTVFVTGQEFCYGPGGGPVSGALRALGLEEFCGGLGASLPGVAGVTGVTGVAGVAADGHGAVTLLDSTDPAVPWLLLTAHIGVGLLAALWLWHGEAALASLLRAAAVSAFRPLLVACAVVAGAWRPVRARLRPVARETVSRPRPLAHSLARRGPPGVAVLLPA